VEITKEMLLDEIKTLKKASSLHAKYSISQYKQVLKTLEKLEHEKKLLEQKVKQRTKHLEVEIKHKESLTKKLEKVAKYDQLTGLANRYLFLNELKIIHEEARLLNQGFALLFIDLDGFKFVNDTYGHDIGDELLQNIAFKIKSFVRSEDLVSRLGGDEFTIILKNLKDKTRVSKIALSIIEKIKQPIKIKNTNIHIGSSIGIYIYENSDDYQEIISKADIAMYESKKAGKGTYTFFGESMQKELHKTITIKNELKNALRKNEFINYFQPIVSSTDYTIKGMEVLLRWRCDGRTVTPGNFIAILEEDINLIRDVTFWQIEEIVKISKEYQLFFSINISAKLLNSNELIEKIKILKSKYNFEPNQIHFEVTETSLSVNLIQASKILLELKNIGFSLSLDDFGTGYSSLAYLRELPFDTLKIDKKFIDNLKYSKRDKKLLLSMLSMAKILDMKIIIEGIEYKKQIALLKQGSYIKYQGFYFYKPMELYQLNFILNKDSILDA
jgi:diguanylate cyclase (GGDEF)-like protein